MNEFERYKNEAQDAVFEGWDFSFLEGRFIEKKFSWNYSELVKSKIKKSGVLLDMGTGGGEFLLSIRDFLPLKAFATEGFKPNVQLARKTLEPLGIVVIEIEDDENLPFGNETFDLIINRHESYSPRELNRILKTGGIFITQQVGDMDNIELNHFFDDSSRDKNDWCLAGAAGELEENGIKINYKKEEFIDSRFMDIGAVIYYLKVITWQIPGFKIEENPGKMKQLHQKIKRENGFSTRQHRFIIIGEKL
ncbi:MAG: class I SAM-dependent methyltransferase [Candidatus Zixiibacteriota bacterium]|nr:MAG: class I SAM-dependent methyltransferase [candidate division Zixibacteria bacterium]